LAFGSYSHLPVGATVSDYPATVHGAFLSGTRAAGRIAKL